MPDEVYEVHNISKGPISCTVYKSYTVPEGTPKHKRRKMLKESSINVLIPAQQSRELVSLTGLSINELKAQPELNKILHGSPPRLVLVSPRKAQPAESAAQVESAPETSQEEKTEETEAPKEKIEESQSSTEETTETSKSESEDEKPKKKTRTKKKKK